MPQAPRLWRVLRLATVLSSVPWGARRGTNERTPMARARRVSPRGLWWGLSDSVAGLRPPRRLQTPHSVSPKTGGPGVGRLLPAGPMV